MSVGVDLLLSSGIVVDVVIVVAVAAVVGLQIRGADVCIRSLTCLQLIATT